ncbi:hypothetical protein OSB04_008386, partial [Centaurea solstitialis]
MEEISRTTTILLLLLLSFHLHKIFSAELHTISDSQLLTDKDTLVSPAGVFELGFFRPDESNENRYLGIWYKKISIKTFVWVANRDFPLTGPPSHHLLTISGAGILLLMNNLTVVWSSNTRTTSPKATANLLDTGNLVVIDEHRNDIWQSFDHPTDTNFLTNKEWYLTSWRSNQDPSPGEFTWSIDTRSYPQILLKQGSVVKFRGGPWNGLRFSDTLLLHRNTIYTYSVVINETEVIFTYKLYNNSVISRLTLDPTGVVQRLVWLEDENKWQPILELPNDTCDSYNICGGYGSCSHGIGNSTTCVCLDETRFVPRNPERWERADWSGGCVRRTALDNCEDGFKSSSDVFIKYSNVKLPDTHNCWFHRSVSLIECEGMCSKNCSCMAFGNMDIREEGSGCLVWFDDLMDLRVYFDGNGGQDIYIRMASSESFTKEDERASGSQKKIIIIIVPAILGLLILLGPCFLIMRKRKLKLKERNCLIAHKDVLDLPMFTLAMLVVATNNFSISNKLGQGGFGPVYKQFSKTTCVKGLLKDGREVAVKRLSVSSSQGVEEFKNEVIFISRLQHRNLVKILGYCFEGQEKMLIYEYMPNKGLDLFLFNETKSKTFDWLQRLHIINGIARGLLYLHQDSRLRIIHRDLKAANILLDHDMNPKISDFGLARSFGGNETTTTTKRVVGTYGYMSPEYAGNGIFSVKSDVFSFGVLMLEIVSGIPNRHNLIGNAWRLYKERKPLELVDSSLIEADYTFKMVRSIQVGLLCVQNNQEDRPNMSTVVMMLSSEGQLPEPKHPGFYIEEVVGDENSNHIQIRNSCNKGKNGEGDVGKNTQGWQNQGYETWEEEGSIDITILA